MKPDNLIANCPYCSEKNKFSILMMGTVNRKIICVGCAKPFYLTVKWKPHIETAKDIDYAESLPIDSCASHT